MAISSANAENFQHSITSLSSVLESFSSLPTMKSLPSLTAVANTNTSAVGQLEIQRTWFGTFGQLTLLLIRVIPSVLYWIITFTTITMPTFLFTLFSTSLTFTMNATTL